MSNNKKLIHCIGRNGSRMSMQPENIVACMPDEKIIGETIVVLAVGASQAQFFVKMPHEQFARIWEGALNGIGAVTGNGE